MVVIVFPLNNIPKVLLVPLSVYRTSGRRPSQFLDPSMVFGSLIGKTGVRRESDVTDQKNRGLNCTLNSERMTKTQVTLRSVFVPE